MLINVMLIKARKLTSSLFLDDTEDFTLDFEHTDMQQRQTNTYNLGDYIRFTLASNTGRNEVKAVLQRCWTNNDGSVKSYNLIENRYVDPI